MQGDISLGELQQLPSGVQPDMYAMVPGEGLFFCLEHTGSCIFPQPQQEQWIPNGMSEGVTKLLSRCVVQIVHLYVAWYFKLHLDPAQEFELS